MDKDGERRSGPDVMPDSPVAPSQTELRGPGEPTASSRGKQAIRVPQGRTDTADRIARRFRTLLWLNGLALVANLGVCVWGWFYGRHMGHGSMMRFAALSLATALGLVQLLGLLPANLYFSLRARRLRGAAGNLADAALGDGFVRDVLGVWLASVAAGAMAAVILLAAPGQ